MVKVFTMVKGEIDIVKDWVMYHGYLFGFENLHIIDNYSKDGTYEMLQSLKEQHNINLYQLPDYKKKGVYMTQLIKRFGRNQVVFPIDIDEFIVYFDKNSNKISVDSIVINEYLQHLQVLPVFSMNYINPKMTITEGFFRAVKQCEYGTYCDYGQIAKKFFNTNLFHETVDHGNHFQTTKYKLSNLCLIHYHCRNLEQMKKKIYNNVLGLGYPPFNLNQLKAILHANPGCPGNHHVTNQINVLTKKYALECHVGEPNDIVISEISEKICD